MRLGDLTGKGAKGKARQAEPRSLAGASFEVGQPVHSGPKLRRTPQRLLFKLGPVVQCCIGLFARGRGHRASSWHSCGSFGPTAPTHLGMPLYRRQTIGSPDAPPETPQPKAHSPLRRAPGLHSSRAAMAASAAGQCTVGGDAAEWHSPGTRAGLQRARRPNLGNRRRRWCASALGVQVSHRVYALKVLTRMPSTRTLLLLSVFCLSYSCSVTCNSTATQTSIQATARTSRRHAT